MREKSAAKKNVAVDVAPESVVMRDARRFNRESRWALPGFAVLVALVLYLWYWWKPEYLEHNEDLIYNLGLIGGIAMLLQFVYAARKRSRKMRQLGQLRIWFVVHMIIGIVAPLIIIIHSRFTIESVNGGVAFFAMLLVVFSGVVGRYLYSQMNFDIASRRQHLGKLQQGVQRAILNGRPQQADDMALALKEFAISALMQRKRPGEAFLAAISLSIRSRILYWQLVDMTLISAETGRGQMAVAADDEGLSEGERRLLMAYLKALTDLARYNAFGQLFALWRIGHVPVIYLLLITGLAHVLAVHMY